jgi:hypothetical protein
MICLLTKPHCPLGEWGKKYITMTFSSREDKKLMQLVAEIDKEVRGKNRGFMIENRTRQIRLLFNKAARREKNVLL